MEVTGVGSSYLDPMVLDNFRLSAASTVHNTPDFAEILERTRSSVSKTGNTETDFIGAPVVSSGRQPIDKTDKLYELCLDLETFVVKNLINGMRNTVQKSGLVDDSFAGKMYEDMLYDEYSKDFTRNANFGLAEQAYRQLKNMY